jgi:Spy/CpxP family protein refolding chaperone
VKKQLGTLLVIIMAGTFAAAVAQPGGRWNDTGNPEKSMTRHLEMLQERLNLSADQVEQIQGIMQTGREESREVAARYGIEKRDHQAMRNLEPEKKQQLRDEMRQLRDSHQSKIAAVLNEEQLAEWKVMQNERRARMKERRPGREY